MLKAPAVVSLDAEDPELLRQVVAYYHQTLKQSSEALAYLKARGIDHPEVVERFQLGYANRTLGTSLPIKQLKAGATIRGRLAKLGLYRDSGHEHFNGSLVVPVTDGDGTILDIYGRKTRDDLRAGTPLHLYLPGPRRGVWNEAGLRGAKDIILAKSLMDALTFWCAGYRNVTAAYGVDGVTQDHLDAFQRHGTQRVLIAFDGDEAGDRAAQRLVLKLTELGIEGTRMHFPDGLDANALALKAPPADQSLGKVIRVAVPVNVGVAMETPVTRAPSQSPAQVNAQVPAQVRTQVPTQLGTQACTRASTSADAIAPTIAAPSVPKVEPPSLPRLGDDIPADIQGQDMLIPLVDRTYRVRGWQKPLNPESLKVNLMVSKDARFHVDTLDLYHAKARVAFVRQASMELGASEDALKTDLGKVLRKVEAVQADQLAAALKVKDPRPVLTEAEQADAMALLTAPDLVDRILLDFATMGVVGEESNKLTGYLAAVSRLLDRPLALLIQSASAAGKSSLMDAVLDLVPEEELVRYSAMSGQSLFYMGNRDLHHKILAIAEEEGARHASYALKLLQSEGRVTMASTGKDAATGMLVTHDYTVEGPVMLFLTTTAIDLDEELLNRCLVLTVNESREQTRAIHALQRSRETLDGMLARDRREGLLKLHRNAQRLLKPLAVVNPYADQLTFQDHQTRSRRDHVKYLTLIRSIALLHQHQRVVRTITHEGQEIQYIEVMPQDIALANELAQEVLGRTVDELLPQTRKLLGLLHEWVQSERGRLGVPQSDFRFTRRDVREALGWGDTQLKVHLGRLAELEFLVPHRGRQGRAYAYELLYTGDDTEGRAKLLGLIEDASFAGTGRGMVGGRSAGGRGAFTALNPSPDRQSSELIAVVSGTAPQGVSESILPVVKGVEA
jgi:PAS domain-containing protein